MVDTFSTDAEMRGLADIRHDLLPISSQPPYSLLLGGCDEIGNKSPLAVRAACSQSLLLAMSWHSSVSDVLSPYPPQPSPAGRGRIISRLAEKSATEFAGQSSAKKKMRNHGSLSSGERVRVRASVKLQIIYPIVAPKTSQSQRESVADKSLPASVNATGPTPADKMHERTVAPCGCAACQDDS